MQRRASIGEAVVLDKITASTWNAAQEEMLERVRATIEKRRYKESPPQQFGDYFYKEVANSTLDNLLAALSSLRAGESTKP